MKLTENLIRIKQVMGLINETDNLKFRRIIPFIDTNLPVELQKTYEIAPQPFFCSLFGKAENFYDTMVEVLTTKIYKEFFSTMDDTGMDWSNLYDQIEIFIDENYKKQIIDFFNEKCDSSRELDKSNKTQQNEGEISEKCWKGYTQKGMKTMFGKKYPNCVKKKK